MLRLAAAAALPWLSFAVQTTPANALAAPWVIIFEGAPLTRPVVIDDWHENQAIMLGLEEFLGRLLPGN